MRLGFSWISLDSLVRIETYQWVTRDFRWRKFRARFARWGGAPERAPASLTCGSAGLSMGNFTQVSDFLQQIAIDLN
jgi:hypothetical protein